VARTALFWILGLLNTLFARPRQKQRQAAKEVQQPVVPVGAEEVGFRQGLCLRHGRLRAEFIP